ncbi:hypothetical protein F5H01DRAFT_372046 [Linnemannia elongata]|nr:hypothetical protein F5H01DRAFT_372046 [Linnemannia elongata]
MASTSYSSRSSSLRPPQKSPKRPSSMSSFVTPHFAYCPIKPIPRPSSAYAELESPPPSPLQQSNFDTNSSHPHDHKQQKPRHQQVNNHVRRFNESRPIQIPMDLLHQSRSPDMFPVKRSLSSTSAVRAAPVLPLKKKYTLFNTPPADKPAASLSPVSRPLSPSRSISSLLFRKQQQPSLSTSSVSIHLVGQRSSPVNTRLDDFDEFEEVPIDSRPVTPTPPIALTTLTATTSATATAVSHAALQKTTNISVDDMDVDMNSADRSSPLSEQTPVAIGSTSRHQTLDMVATMTINNNQSNIDLTNSLREQPSTSIITTSFRVPATPHHTTTTTSQEKELSTPKRKKSLLKSMSSSMRQVKKRATDLFGGIRQRSKRSKNLKPDQGEVDEGSLVTKVEDRQPDSEDYDLSTLSLAATIGPFNVLPSCTTTPSRVDSSYIPPRDSCPMEIDVISISSDASKSSDHTAPPLAAAVAVDLLQLSWSSPSGPSLFTRSAEDLTRNPISSFYDFSNCDPYLPNVGLSLTTETEADRPHHVRPSRSKSESAAPMMTPKKPASLSSIPFARHLRLHYDLKENDTNEEGAKQKEKQATKSSRFGGLGSSDWIASKNHSVSKFMTRYKKGGKKGKDKGYLETNGFTLGGMGGNRSDPFRDPDVDECAELIFADTPAPKFSPSSPKVSCTETRHSTRLPSSPSSSFSSLLASSPSSPSPTCEVSFQHAINRRMSVKQQQQQQQRKQEEQQRQQQGQQRQWPQDQEQEERAPQVKSLRRSSSTPAVSTRQQPPPSIVVFSSRGSQELFVPSP